MNKQFNDVSLVYTHTLKTMSQYGAFQYSFIVNKDVFLAACRQAIEANKRISWSSNDTTDAKLLKLAHVKFSKDIENEDIKAHMNDDDILVSVKGMRGTGKDKKPAMIRTTNSTKQPAWFSIANVIVDLYVWEWNNKKGISCQANGDMITIQVTKYADTYNENVIQGFASEDEITNPVESGFNDETIFDEEAPF